MNEENHPHERVRSPPDGNTFTRGRRADTELLGGLGVLVGRTLSLLVIVVVDAGASVQETGLLDGASTLKTNRSWVPADAAGHLLASLGADAAAVAGRYGGAGRRRRQVWDVFGNRVPGANVGDADIRRLAGLAEGVVAGVEVLAFLGPVNQRAVPLSAAWRGIPSACSAADLSWLASCHRDATDVVHPG